MSRETKGLRDPIEVHRGWLLIGLIALILIGVLFPREGPGENRLEWNDEGSGLAIHDSAQALSETPILSTTGGLTVEIYLQHGFTEGHGNQEILSFVDDEEIRPLILGQFPKGYLMSGRADNPKGEPREDLYIRTKSLGIVDPNDVIHLAVTVGDRGARLYVCGRDSGLVLEKTRAVPGVPFGGRLLVGSSGAGWPGWTGRIRGIAIYDRALSTPEIQAHANATAELSTPVMQSDSSVLAFYPFDEGSGLRAASVVSPAPDLIVPASLIQPTRKNFLSARLPRKGKHNWLLLDCLINILIFMPLGFLIAWKKSPYVIGIALACGFGVSLGVEISQSMIPGRSSSLFDLGANSLGALTGALFGRFPLFTRLSRHWAKDSYC